MTPARGPARARDAAAPLASGQGHWHVRAVAGQGVWVGASPGLPYARVSTQPLASAVSTARQPAPRAFTRGGQIGDRSRDLATWAGGTPSEWEMLGGLSVRKAPSAHATPMTSVPTATSVRVVRVARGSDVIIMAPELLGRGRPVSPSRAKAWRSPKAPPPAPAGPRRPGPTPVARRPDILPGLPLLLCYVQKAIRKGVTVNCEEEGEDIYI